MNTIEVHYKNVDLEITFEYTPAERQTWYEPGIPEDVSIEGVKINNQEVMHILDDKFIDELIDVVLASREYDNE